MGLIPGVGYLWHPPECFGYLALGPVVEPRGDAP